MRNPHGTPIWYELMTKDPLAARAFYGKVIGWDINEHLPPDATMDYRMITAGDQQVGGVMTLNDAMCEQGARPCWAMYVGVDDVDACVASISAAGGQALLPAFDIPNVGRIAMVTDPQGAPFYVMTDTSGEPSSAYNPEQAGHGAWHELHSSDGPASTAFYAAQFGWTRGEGMDMGPGGIYQLMQLGGRDFGAIMTDPAFPHPMWLLYFCTGSIEAAAQRVVEAGGQVIVPPMEVPGETWILNALDPEGVMFALAGTR